jgi:hypothetical protein
MENYTYDTNSIDDFITKIAIDLNQINNAVYTKKDNFILANETEKRLLTETYETLAFVQAKLMRYKRGEL